MKPVCLDLHECNGLGDLICATPTIKKLSESYEQQITILSKMPELFKNNPYVDKSYKYSSVDIGYFNTHFIMHNSFYNVGKKNEYGIEYKHNRIDIRQFHAINLGFQLLESEMDCYYRPTEDCKIDIPKGEYVVIHPTQNWATRTWSEENWTELVQRLTDHGIIVVAIGKDSSETGFFNVNKPVFRLKTDKIINLINKTSISDCWHLIENSNAVITMDSGILHLAGTTNANIVLLGSSINPEYRIPYRLGVKGLKVSYVAGNCPIYCSSDMKYGVKEWGSIQGVPPLIKCLENKPTFECHPSVDKVLNILQHI